MKPILKSVALSIVCLTIWSCNNEASKVKVEQRKTIEMVTDKGTMVIELYNETPLHRDNFIKLAKNKAFDSLLFHRVINEFMIQGGDPDSKYAKPQDTLGEGDLPYLVDAEIHPDLFHKKGVLAAARDDTPNRESSPMQFYIVQGKVWNDSLIDRSEDRINGWLAEHVLKKDSIHQPLLDALQKSYTDGNRELATLLSDSIKGLAKTYESFQTYTIPESHRDVYKTLGGTPHLDQNYTVFGEVISGIDVVDSIASVQTNTMDRPITDVRIRSVKVKD